MKRTKSYAALKREMDKVWSIWIRRSDADRNGMVRCVTCGAKDEWKWMQCGHFIPRHYLAGRYNPDNTYIQCPACNVFLRGNYPAFAAFLVKIKGAQFLDELIDLKRQTVKFTRSDLQAMIDKTKADIAGLDESHR